MLWAVSEACKQALTTTIGLMLYRFASCALDLTRGSLRVDGDDVELRPKAFAVLRHFVENPGRLIPKDELIKTVWPTTIVSDESLSNCISEIRRAICDHDQSVIKTVSRRGYLLAADVARSTAMDVGSRSIDTLPAEKDMMPDRASVAVLAFADMSEGPSQEYLSDGVTEDIITELSRFSDLLVIARNSSFQYKGKSVDVRQIGRELGAKYVVEGSVRRDGNRIRITAQLVDASLGVHRWAERYDRELKDTFAVQDEIACTIASILAAHLGRAETQRTARKPPTQWLAYDYVVRASAVYELYHSTMQVADLDTCRVLLSKALALDPDYGRPHALLAATCYSEFIQPQSEHYLQWPVLERALGAARQAISLDPMLAQAHATQSIVLSSMGEHDQALAALERVRVLNPSYSGNYFGAVLYRAGEPARAIEELKRTIRLDPYYLPATAGWLGVAYGRLEQYAMAIPYLEEFVTRSPENRHAHAWLAASLAMMGDLDRARKEAAEVLRIDPNYRISTGLIGRFKRPEYMAYSVEALRRAGLPE